MLSRNFLPSIWPNDEIIRKTSCSVGISKLNTATGFGSLLVIATFSIMFIENAVLPIEGLPAIIIKSPFCSPDVILSRSLNPVSSPVTPVDSCIS